VSHRSPVQALIPSVFNIQINVILPYKSRPPKWVFYPFRFSDWNFVIKESYELSSSSHDKTQMLSTVRLAVLAYFRGDFVGRCLCFNLFICKIED
jgi:hypothetical protein